ncbi:MAG: hypothetical protein ACOC1F_07200, partial [Myxococcota bacterium]
MADPHLADLVRKHLRSRSRWLVSAPPGGAAMRLATDLADAAAQRWGACQVLITDPADGENKPATALALAQRRDQAWQLLGLEGLGTLDGARFRGPLAVAVARLAAAASELPMLVVMPGLTRGVAAFELPAMLAKASGATGAVLVDVPSVRELAPCFRTSPLRLIWTPDAAGSRLTDSERRAARRATWRSYMQRAKPIELERGRIDVIGLPPPDDADQAWSGRVAAVLDADGVTICLGQILSKEADRLQLIGPCAEPNTIRGLCVRDACVEPLQGEVVTAEAPNGLAAEETRRARNRTPGRAFELPTIDHTAVPVEIPPLGHKGEVVCDLVNGVFGDPLLHVRLVSKRRSLLFDIGEAGLLPRRIAHQVTHVFVSHAHMDHVAGLV